MRTRRHKKKDTPLVIICVCISFVILISAAKASGIIGADKNKAEAQISQSVDKNDKTDNSLKIQLVRSTPTISLYDTKQDKIIQLDAESYLIGTVAAEMPALFDKEALKAQAVACRTWLYKHMEAGGCGRKKGADICSDFNHCQAWDSDGVLKEKWGKGYEDYFGIIAHAVSSTKGQIMTYDDEPIRAYYHSVSGGKTEDVTAVFGGNESYLVSVDSPGEERAPSYRTVREYTFQQLYQRVRGAYPKVILTHGDIENELRILSRDESGRVAKLRIGEQEITGVEARKLFDLGSANFTIEFVNSKIKFTSTGHGHGVGMSQYGADSMAKQGAGYDAILKHYYVGIQLHTVWE